MIRKGLFCLVLATFIAGGVFAQEEDAQEENPVIEADVAAQSKAATHKHSAGDMLLGLNWSFFGAIMNTNPIGAFSKVGDTLKFDTVIDLPNVTINASMDLPKFFVTARMLNIGLSYEYYVFHWMSVGTGLGFGPEVNVATKGGTTNIGITADVVDYANDQAAAEEAVTSSAINQVLKAVHIQAGLFLTIPFNVHFNIPKVEWLYGGLGVEIHIPLTDLGLGRLIGDLAGTDIAKYLPGGSLKGKTFVSMPIDIGFDFSRTRSNGKPRMSRLLFRVEPEFFGNGMISLPISLVWQSNLWKLANVAIPGAK